MSADHWVSRDEDADGELVNGPEKVLLREVGSGSEGTWVCLPHRVELVRSEHAIDVHCELHS